MSADNLSADWLSWRVSRWLSAGARPCLTRGWLPTDAVRAADAAVDDNDAGWPVDAADKWPSFSRRTYVFSRNLQGPHVRCKSHFTRVGLTAAVGQWLAWLSNDLRWCDVALLFSADCYSRTSHHPRTTFYHFVSPHRSDTHIHILSWHISSLWLPYIL